MAGPGTIIGLGFEQVVRDATVAIAVIDESGRVIYSNTKARELTRRVGTEMPADLDDGIDIFYPDGSRYERGDWPAARSIASGESVVEEEYFHELPHGGRLWSRCSSSPVRDENGEIVAAVLAMTDVTALKREEERSVHLAELLDHLQDAVLVTDDRFVLTAWNHGAVAMFGWTAEEAIGRVIWELVPQDSDERQADDYAELTRTGQWRGERVWRAKDGAPVVAEGLTAVTRGDGGDITGYIGILRDVAERKHAEQATRESQRRIETVLESVTDAFYALDRDWRLTYVNERALEFASQLAGRELTRDEMLDETLWTLYPGTVGTWLEDTYRRAMREQEPVAFEYQYPGSEPWMEVHVYPSEQGLSIYFQDITERKRVEAQLAESARQQAALVEAERRRIARDLHDGALQELSAAIATTTDQRLQSSLKGVGEQLRAAIYDLRLEEEQARGLASALRQLVALQAEMPGGSAIELDVGDGTPERDLGEVGAETLRIAGEAVANARRHSGASTIRVSTCVDGDLLRVEVTDDGKGFDPREEPTAAQSTGLQGVRERAELIGGRLQIDSAHGRGTTVSIEVSLGGRRSQAATARILLVEDHAAMREGLAAVLEREPDLEVSGQAASLAEARELLDGVDLALIDLGLPDGSGIDLINELQAASPRAQVLILSAGFDRPELARAIQAGAAGVLSKTVAVDEIVDAVRRLRAGEVLFPLDEVVDLLRFAGEHQRQEYEARQAIAQLTPRELEVLQALAEGLDSQAVADRLFITLRTERNHVANILAKLGVHSQLQAVVFAVRHGAIEIR